MRVEERERISQEERIEERNRQEDQRRRDDQSFQLQMNMTNMMINLHRHVPPS